MEDDNGKSLDSFSTVHKTGITAPLVPPNKYSKTECWQSGAD